jgi:hypothetical protein
MLSKYDLPSFIFYYLNKNNKWFSKYDLYNGIKNEFLENELYIGHYLFTWYRLLHNMHCVDVIYITVNNTKHPLIKSKTFENKYKDYDNEDGHIINPESFNEFKIDINEMIQYVVNNSNFYIGSKLLNKYLLDITDNKYNNITDILKSDLISLDKHIIDKFMHLIVLE